jgi:hypothetical protein
VRLANLATCTLKVVFGCGFIIYLSGSTSPGTAEPDPAHPSGFTLKKSEGLGEKESFEEQSWGLQQMHPS